MELEGRGPALQLLIHDRYSKFSGPFDEVFRTEGPEVIRTPIRAPNANAHAERFIRTIRAECLDWTPILGRSHLDRALPRIRRALQPPKTTPGAWSGRPGGRQW